MAVGWSEGRGEGGTGALGPQVIGRSEWGHGRASSRKAPGLWLEGLGHQGAPWGRWPGRRHWPGLFLVPGSLYLLGPRVVCGSL